MFPNDPKREKKNPQQQLKEMVTAGWELFKDFLPDIESQEELTKKHRAEIVEMIADYFVPHLGDDARKAERIAPTLIAALLNFEPLTDSALTPWLEGLRRQVIKVELIYEIKGNRYNASAKIHWLDDVDVEGAKPKLKAVTVTKSFEDVDLPDDFRAQIQSTHARRERLSYPLYSSTPSHNLTQAKEG